jgi:hypothetical protein
MLLFIAICCTDCYSFVLSSSLLISFVSHFVPVLYSTIWSWCILALQMVCLPSNNIRLLIKYCTFFPFPSTHFAHVSVILLEFLLSWNISLQSCTDYPPSQPLASTLLADTTLLRLFTTHTLLYINSILGQRAFFWILEP